MATTSSSSEPTDNQDTAKPSRISINELLLASASILVLGLLQYTLKPLDGLEREVLLASCAMAVVVPLLLWISPPKTKEKEKPISAGVFLLVFAAFLALGLLQYTWTPLAKFPPEVLPMLFVMAVVVLNLLWICANKIVGYVRYAYHADSKKDLKSDMADCRATLNLRKQRNPGPPADSIAVLCEDFLKKAAKKCRDEKEVGQAWRYLVQARLHSLLLLKSNDPLVKNLASETLARSAAELIPSRRIAVARILEEPNHPGQLKRSVTEIDLFSANCILEEYVNEKYDSLDRSAWQLYVLCAVGVVCVIVLGVLLPNLSISEPSLLQENKMLVLVIIITGALGGATGGFFSVLRLFKTKDSIAHEQTMSSWMIVIRPLIGAVFALFASWALLSGFVNMGEVTIELLLSICFVAGFSEHFVIDLANRLAKADSAKETSEKE